MVQSEKERPLLDVHSPVDGRKVGSVPVPSREDAEDALRRARVAQARWAARSFAERRDVLLAFADRLLATSDEIARLLCRENGKTYYEALVFEILPLAHLTMYFAKNAGRILKPKKIPISLMWHRASYVHYKPRGVVLVISPWNFPLTIPFGEVIMSLAAGNAVLLKPASLTPMVAHRMRELMDEAGLDADLFRVLSVPGRVASELIESGVDYVNFTGSTAVGQDVAALCGRHLIPMSMELGGKDPAVVLDDADVEYAARSVVWGAFANSGQICASIERVYVVESVYDRFVAKAAEIAGSLRQGDPLSEAETDVGAMTDPEQVEVVEGQVADAIERGARVLCGGKRLEGDGLFYAPTLLVDATDEMRVVHEETFGPLLPILKVADAEEAIARANDSPYGLSAYVYSEDRKRARRVAERLEAGTVVVNDTLITHGFPETPWGGVKQSGIGRVHSDEGLRALCQSYHVNREVIRFRLPVSYPYTEGKVRFAKQVGRLFRAWLAVSRGKAKVAAALAGSRALSTPSIPTDVAETDAP